MTTPPLSEQRALDLDAADPVPSRRDEFHLLAAEAGDYPEVA